MDKTALRQVGIKRLATLSKTTKAKKETLICQLLFASKTWQNAKTIGLFRSTKNEFSTLPLFQRAFAENKKVVVPQTFSDRRMVFHQVKAESDYQLTSFGIEEPVEMQPVTATEIDLLIVPGVVFSSEGYRIGYGGGYYDRYLADFTGETISLVFREQIMEDWLPDSFDVPIKRLICDSYEREGAR